MCYLKRNSVRNHTIIDFDLTPGHHFMLLRMVQSDKIKMAGECETVLQGWTWNWMKGSENYVRFIRKSSQRNERYLFPLLYNSLCSWSILACLLCKGENLWRHFMNSSLRLYIFKSGRPGITGMEDRNRFSDNVFTILLQIQVCFLTDIFFSHNTNYCFFSIFCS